MRRGPLVAFTILICCFTTVSAPSRAEDVAPGVVFDPEFYLQSYADLRAAFGGNQSAASSHWSSNGRGEGRISSPAFDVQYYLANNPDLQTAYGTNYSGVVDHWQVFGVKEGRRGSIVFDVRYYLANNADLRAHYGETNFVGAMNHWIIYGVNEGRRGSAEFDPKFYLARYPDIATTLGSNNYKAAIAHYLEYGRKEGREGQGVLTVAERSPVDLGSVFDPEFYLQCYGDLRNAFGSDHARAAEHWRNNGKAEGRVSSPAFDVQYYLEKNPDLKATFGTDYAAAVSHWMSSGIKEGRRGARIFDVRYYLAKNPDLVTAYGAEGYAGAVNHWVAFGIKEGRKGSADFASQDYLALYPDIGNALGCAAYKAASAHYLEHGIKEGRSGVTQGMSVDTTALGQLAASSRFDLRAAGFRPPQDQGDFWARLGSSFAKLGTCWSFAAASTIESSYQRLYGVSPDLSEQDLINCSGAGDQDGGNAYKAYEWLKSKGNMHFERERPYTGIKRLCEATDGKYGIKSWGWACGDHAVGSAEHTKALKLAIVTRGALSTSVHSDAAFKSYSSGVFEGTNPAGTNHAVCIIGWDDSKGAWIIKNSWSSSWGQTCDWGSASGYGYVKYGSNSIGTSAAWVEALPPPNNGYARVFCQAGYVTKFTTTYTHDGQHKSETAELAVGSGKMFSIPHNATNVYVVGKMVGGNTIFNEGPFTGPPNKCFKTYGSIFDASWNSECDMAYNSGDLPQVAEVGYVKVFCQAGYVSKFTLVTMNGSSETSESVKLGAGNTKIWQLPKTWKGRIEGYRVNVIGDDTQLFRQELCAPPNGCYKTYGTIFDSQWSNNCD